jgi:hypothetical protein
VPKENITTSQEGENDLPSFSSEIVNKNDTIISPKPDDGFGIV